MKEESIRCEYEEWAMLTDLFLYEETKFEHHLIKAKERFNLLASFTNPDGGIKFGSNDSKVWVGENGLASWAAIKLYKITKNATYLNQASFWLNYCITNPPKVNKKEPRLRPVFLAWMNYALMEMSTVTKGTPQREMIEFSEQCTEEILKLQRPSKRWGICYHYDMYVARNLLYAYKFFSINNYNMELGTRCLVALTQFMKSTRYSKIPLLDMRPIHYLFLDWKGSGYTTAQYSQLCYELYLTYYNIDDYLEGKIALQAIQNHLMKKDGTIVKRWLQRRSNALATDWYRYIEALDKKCEKIAKETL